MLSDILIMFSKALGDSDMAAAKALLMDIGRSVIVHQKDGQSRVLLVKFDPNEVIPGALLEALKAKGFSAKMSGG